MNRRCWLPVAALVAGSLTLGAQPKFADYADGLDEVLVSPGQFEPLPRAADDFWRTAVPESMRRSYTAYGEQALGKPWAALPLTAFAQFCETGNRVGYEQLCFDKRRQLAALVMAEVAEGQGRFVPAIIDGLGSLFEETWWGIPAHYAKKVPLAGEQTVDLFNAETAGLVAWTVYMLRPQLEQFSPLLVQRAASELQRRLLTPARTGKYWWKTAGMNWNPWICSNWLACALLFETDRQRQLDAVGQVLRAMDAFTDSYPADGGCDEGPGYWDRAAASLYDCLELLGRATGGRIDARSHPKVRAMASYAYKTYIGHGYVLCFADSHENRYMQQLNVLYPFACYLDDPVMRRFAKYIGDDKDYLRQAAALYDRSGNFPTLGRELNFLSCIDDFRREQAGEPLLGQVWLPDLQVWAARTPVRPADGTSALYVAMKGGHNGESHNHNDVGQLVVYADGEPLLVDPAVGEYTAKTFSKQRYDIWTMQSQFHNLPQINGCDQRDGRQFAASVVAQSATRLTLELAAAYPEAAAVGQWRRTVELWRKKEVRVTEDYVLKAWEAPTRLMLMTTTQPVAAAPGRLLLGAHALDYDAGQLEVQTEDVSDRMDALLRGIWGEKMYRVVLTVKGRSLAGTIRYTIK